MRGFVPPDPETGVSAERYAVVYVPKRSRSRFPAGSVDINNSQSTALLDAVCRIHITLYDYQINSTDNPFWFALT